jgi:hypothetical protein
MPKFGDCTGCIGYSCCAAADLGGANCGRYGVPEEPSWSSSGVAAFKDFARFAVDGALDDDEEELDEELDEDDE